MQRSGFAQSLTALLLAASIANAGVIGETDDRYHGDDAQFDPANRSAIARVLKVSASGATSAVATATALCSRDTVITAAHIVRASPIGLWHPKSLQLELAGAAANPAQRYRVIDWMMAHGRSLDRERLLAIEPASDFIVLRLDRPLPAPVAPLALPSGLPANCTQATLNAAFHDDLAARDSRHRPYLSKSVTPLIRNDPDLLKLPWYRPARLASTAHDFDTGASGSAIYCPADGEARDSLMAIAVGHTVIDKPGQPRSFRNIVSTDLRQISSALAKLNGESVERLLAHCGDTAPADSAPTLLSLEDDY